MKKLLLFPLLMLLAYAAFTQVPTIQWQKCLGGSALDEALSFQQTADGGYILAGTSTSNDGDLSGNPRTGYDYWIVKLDAARNIQWQKSLGGNGTDIAFSVRQTADGGYIAAGQSDSNDGDVSGNHGGYDYWVIKLNSTGNIQWQKSLGGSYTEGAASVQQTVDGGYILAGGSPSIDGDVTGNHGITDFWIVKLDTAGNIQWQESLGGSGNDRTDYDQSIYQTADSGYIVAGYSNSNDGDVSGNHGGYDYWIVKLNSNGNIQWQKSFGGSNDDLATSIKQTTDGGYIVAGYSNSNDGDVSGNHGGNWDEWVVKLDASGNMQWQKCLGGTHDEIPTSVQQTTDGGYVVAGISTSNDGDVSGNHSSYNDCWVVKLNTLGNIEWQKCLGGTYDEGAASIQQAADGGYVVVGTTSSNDGDVSGNHATYGTEDFWIVKLSADVTLPLQLISFTGILENNTIKLNWQSTNQINTADFIVERSNNNVNNFSAISKVNAQNTFALTNSYKYTDDALLQGINYYRLKMEDKDGKFTYSNVVKINYTNDNATTIIISPNPFSNSTTISFTLSQSQKVSAGIFDDAGRLIKNITDAQMEAGSHQLTWNAAGVANGTYYLRFNAGHYAETKKIVVLK
jgi:Secretion system C-terminal sorting domain